jgi:hypothetical protein
MSIKSKTVIFVFVSIGLLAVSWLVFDIYAINEGGTEASISFMIYEWSYKYPLFTLMCGFIPGFLGGHFFWRIRDTETTKRLSDESRK